MSDPLFDVSGKVTLVSGGSRGIGRALAQGFAGRRAKVIVTGRNSATIEEAARLLSTPEQPVEPRVCDVADLGSIDDCVSWVLERFGRIDVLLNVAGVNVRKPAIDFEETDYDHVVNINQKGAFFLAQAVGRAMARQQSGAIINVDSMSTYAPLKSVLPYSMSKSALVAMTRGLALEWGSHGIRVNSIAPGFILTDLTEKLWSDETMQSWAHANTPLGRLGRPEDLVGAAVFLASDAAKFMSGQVVRVDGGFTAGLNWPIPPDGGQ